MNTSSSLSAIKKRNAETFYEISAKGMVFEEAWLPAKGGAAEADLSGSSSSEVLFFMGSNV